MGPPLPGQSTDDHADQEQFHSIAAIPTCWLVSGHRSRHSPRTLTAPDHPEDSEGVLIAPDGWIALPFTRVPEAKQVKNQVPEGQRVLRRARSGGRLTRRYVVDSATPEASGV